MHRSTEHAGLIQKEQVALISLGLFVTGSHVAQAGLPGPSKCCDYGRVCAPLLCFLPWFVGGAVLLSTVANSCLFLPFNLWSLNKQQLVQYCPSAVLEPFGGLWGLDCLLFPSALSCSSLKLSSMGCSPQPNFSHENSFSSVQRRYSSEHSYWPFYTRFSS